MGGIKLDIGSMLDVDLDVSDRSSFRKNKFSDEAAERIVDVADNLSEVVTPIPDEPDAPQTPDDPWW